MPGHSLSAMCKHYFVCCLSLSVSSSNIEIAAISQSEGHIPVLPEMPKMFLIDTDTFPTPSKQMLVHML
jgi:hypothetical protein